MKQLTLSYQLATGSELWDWYMVLAAAFTVKMLVPNFSKLLVIIYFIHFCNNDIKHKLSFIVKCLPSVIFSGGT